MKGKLSARASGLNAGLNAWGKGSRKHCETDAERAAWDKAYKEGCDARKAPVKPHKKTRRTRRRRF